MPLNHITTNHIPLNHILNIDFRYFFRRRTNKRAHVIFHNNSHFSLKHVIINVKHPNMKNNN